MFLKAQINSRTNALKQGFVTYRGDVPKSPKMIPQQE
jgi:hypothetical protein